MLQRACEDEVRGIQPHDLTRHQCHDYFISRSMRLRAYTVHTTILPATIDSSITNAYLINNNNNIVKILCYS